LLCSQFGSDGVIFCSICFTCQILPPSRYSVALPYREQSHHFADVWRNWSPENRQLFTTVGLANANALLPGRRFQLDALLAGLADWGPEVRELEYTGLLVQDGTIPGGWRVTRQIMLWWLADELARAMRSDSAFAQWLRTAQLEGRWTGKQRNEVAEAARGLGRGVRDLMQAFAAGVGMGIANG
jgi:hypothetical protein